ncbi:glycosyltransferase family 1 protein [Rubellicoccus peritrichatus]|uniref:Glycosyltransferase family 1 protein n=1 Tax=Rubellicoccus peritrichatus TaxID=3080537 RepID=A0AAQ3QST7_9BACT|nr:glycosyltransferase family 1 protein [Puniceicoccus sp. CR14]WOO42923.1 glycosyltransferase family 1 protein [Puniceicoccus sp. CR14]
MHLIVDASNIRKGGGVTHLQEVLNAVDFKDFGFSKITVWAPMSTLDRINSRHSLVFKSHPYIEQGGGRAYWFRKKFDRYLSNDASLLWAPGGTYIGSFQPYVTMVRNFLPFEEKERDRFKYSKTWLRYLYLRHTQTYSFKHAKGLIQISQKTSEVINSCMDLHGVRQVVIHHGLNERFLAYPRAQRDYSEFSDAEPVRLLYVSPINHYKHQDKLIAAVAKLREKKIPIVVDLVGPAFPAAKKVFNSIADRLDPDREWIHWHGEIPYSEVQAYYQKADIYACMSTCETFGMILLEAMASGLPILCSNRSALPEINGGTSPEVDPEDINAVATELERLILDRELRVSCALAAYERAKTFTWQRCADNTFEFLAECAGRD